MTIPDTSRRVRKSSESTPIGKLSRMLQSTLRRFPTAKLWIMQDGFGVYLGGETYLHVHYSGRLRTADLRDLLALFATWLVADERRLRGESPDLDGVFVEDPMPRARFSSRRNSEWIW